MGLRGIQGRGYAGWGGESRKEGGKPLSEQYVDAHGREFKTALSTKNVLSQFFVNTHAWLYELG
jgi:hypothetical protein